LDEAFCFSVGARGEGPGETVLDVLLVEQHTEAPVAVAGAVAGEDTADAEAQAREVDAGHVDEALVWSGRMADCEQLFRRGLLNIRVHNTDNHLSNHGFFVDAEGIRLSPAYDINPTVDRNELSLAIDETEMTCDVSVAMNAYKSYGISATQADAALKSIEAAVATWRAEATRLGIPRAEQNLMVTAFE